jgi:crotonobetainyl-CoA:carnitine CoA-transferase CaiB-like acyl-CoA transferase
MLPFEQIKIVDFSQRLPGPYCSSILADLGAEVTLVERAGNVPETRSVFPGLFELINRNKRSMTLNMKTSEGLQIAEKIIKDSDVLIEEFRPGVAERLGIGYEQVKQINPAIVYCSISGFGQDGPYRDRVGHDINYLSLSGILSIPGQYNIPPARPGVPLVDLASGMYAAMAIMAAIRKRDMDGVGQYIDLSMFDSMISWMGVRAGNYLVHGETLANDHLSPLNSIYTTKDNRRMAVGMIEAHFWANFCKAANCEDLLDDPRFSTVEKKKENSKELVEIIQEIIGSKTLSEWEEILDWKKVPYAPVREMEEALNDPHVEAREQLERIDAGPLGSIREVLFPAKFSGFQPHIRKPPPSWGEHTDEILGEIGYVESDIKRLREKKIV